MQTSLNLQKSLQIRVMIQGRDGSEADIRYNFFTPYQMKILFSIQNGDKEGESVENLKKKRDVICEWSNTCITCSSE